MQDSHSNSNALTWVLGGALVLIGLFVVILLVSVNSQADSVSTSTSVVNVAPFVTGLTLSVAGSVVAQNTRATLTSGNTTSFVLTGTITDANGVSSNDTDQNMFTNGDLKQLDVAIRNASEICDTNNLDNNDCYASTETAAVSDTECDLTGSTTTTAGFTCTFAVEYYADSTSTGGADAADDWNADVTVTDDSNATGSATVVFEIGTLLALNIPSTIAYGTLAREQSTTNSNNHEMTLTQYGNDQADVEVSGTTMPCSIIGTIAIASQEWGLTDLSASTVGVTDLTGSAVDTNIAIGYRTNDASALTKILYWNITIPNVASGSCTGTNTITAIAA